MHSMRSNSFDNFDAFKYYIQVTAHKNAHDPRFARDHCHAVQEAFVLDVIARVSSMYRRYVGELPTTTLDPPEVQSLHR